MYWTCISGPLASGFGVLGLGSLNPKPYDAGVWVGHDLQAEEDFVWIAVV